MSFLDGASNMAVTVIEIVEKTPLKEVLRGLLSAP